MDLANHKSAEKRARQSRKRYMRNKAYRTRLKNVLKKTRIALASEDPSRFPDILKEAERAIRKINSKGVIHKNKASRLISRLYRRAVLEK